MTGSHKEDVTEPSRCSKYLPCSAFHRHVGKHAGFSTTEPSSESPDCDGAARTAGGAVIIYRIGTAAGILDPARSGDPRSRPRRRARRLVRGDRALPAAARPGATAHRDPAQEQG